MADYAEQHGDRFVRILSVSAVGDGTLRSLDLQDAAVRDAVRAFTGGQVAALYEGPHALAYQ